MLSTPHLFVGGALGSLVKRGPIAFCAGVISHHLADCILHTDTGTYQQDCSDGPHYGPVETAVVAVDLALGAALLHAATRRHHGERRPILMGALGGILPDLIDNAPVVGRRFRATSFGRRYHAMHEHLHHTAEPHEWLAGAVTQLAAVLWGAVLLRR